MKALKSRLQAGEAVYGVFCSTPAIVTVELIAATGYDFVIFDLEHTLIAPDELRSMLIAARASGLAALVRVSAHHQIVQVLDAGAQGVVIPRVRDARDIEPAVAQAHFAPRGMRGLNATWRSRYGRLDLVETMQRESAEVLVIAMIEDLEGLRHARTIASVDGVDALLEGAADLSQSIGVPWQLRHDEVQGAIADVARAAAAAGKWFCALPRNTAEMQHWRAHQAQLFVLGDDRGILRRALGAHLESYRNTGVTS